MACLLLSLCRVCIVVDFRLAHVPVAVWPKHVNTRHNSRVEFACSHEWISQRSPKKELYFFVILCARRQRLHGLNSEKVGIST